MIYYTVVLRRRSDFTRDEFERVWLGEHLPLAQRLPGLIEARFLPSEPNAAQTDDDTPDGVGLLIFASLDDLDAALATPAAAELRRHTATFADSDRAVRIVARDPT